jgi:hypothetical protein
MQSATALALVLVAACSSSTPKTAPRAEAKNEMNGAISPAGDRHPGEIVHEDKIENRVWTKRADEVPPTIAWVEVEGKWIPVVRIEIAGTSGHREITKFGPGGQFLETTVQSPPRPRP